MPNMQQHTGKDAIRPKFYKVGKQETKIENTRHFDDDWQTDNCQSVKENTLDNETLTSKTIFRKIRQCMTINKTR